MWVQNAMQGHSRFLAGQRASVVMQRAGQLHRSIAAKAAEDNRRATQPAAASATSQQGSKTDGASSSAAAAQPNVQAAAPPPAALPPATSAAAEQPAAAQATSEQETVNPAVTSAQPSSAAAAPSPAPPKPPPAATSPPAAAASAAVPHAEPAQSPAAGGSAQQVAAPAASDASAAAVAATSQSPPPAAAPARASAAETPEPAAAAAPSPRPPPSQAATPQRPAARRAIAKAAAQAVPEPNPVAAIPDSQIFPGFDTTPRIRNTTSEFVDIGDGPACVLRMKQLLRQTVREIRPQHVAEIGFGQDPSLDVYATVPYDMKVTLIDGSALSMGPARDQASSLGLDYKNRCRFVVSTADNIALPDASFDMVMCVNALTTVWDPFTSVRELRRVVRPGGVVVFLQVTRAEAGSLARLAQERLGPLVTEDDYTREWDGYFRRAFDKIEIEKYKVQGSLLRSRVIMGRAFV